MKILIDRTGVKITKRILTAITLFTCLIAACGILSPKKDREVTYRVTGLPLMRADVSYTNAGGGTTQERANGLPWSKTFTIKEGTTIELVAQRVGGNTGQTHTATILIDDGYRYGGLK